VVDGARCGEAGRGGVRMDLATPEPVLTEIVTRMAAVLARR
jgi:cystathionine beta-lyase